MSETFDVLVVGAGSAGLAVSHHLSQAGIAHAVLDRGRVGHTWRGRWDSFCLVTPNWSVQLPGHSYDGPEPDGFMPRDEIVGYLERYARAVDAPVVEGVEVTALEPGALGGYTLETSLGPLNARAVVVCTGAYQRPHRPAAAAMLPAHLLQLDVEDYRHPGALPPGAVLVVGSGQSGCQIAEELGEAGRRSFLACGRTGWAPRRIGGRDLFWWLRETGELDAPVGRLPNPAARLIGNVQASGRGGGHDLHYRTLQRLGVTLLGHFLGADDHSARFAADLADTIAWADQRTAQFLEKVRALGAGRGMPPLRIPAVAPFRGGAPETVDLHQLGAVVFASGFRPDYARWMRCPGAFDEFGFPRHRDGESTTTPGLYFVGVHFLRTRKSSLLLGVGEDAALVAGRVAASRALAGG